MKHILLILLLFLFFPLQGEEKAATSPPGGNKVRLELVSNIFLGLETRQLTTQERAAYGKKLSSFYGLLITRVVPGSPAEKAGLQSGELLLYVNGASLASPEDLLVSMRNFRPGTPVQFTRLRGDKRELVKLIPAERPEPVVVGYLLPPVLHAEYAAELKPRQIQVARMLAEEVPQLERVHAEMKAISERHNSSYAPGNLRLSFSKDGCRISVTQYWQCLTVAMEENGTETSCELRNEGDTLPEPMRQRLREMMKPRNTQQ